MPKGEQIIKFHKKHFIYFITLANIFLSQLATLLSSWIQKNPGTFSFIPTCFLPSGNKIPVYFQSGKKILVYLSSGNKNRFLFLPEK